MIRLLLVDDQSLICQGLQAVQAVLDQEADLQVVGSAENGQVALDLVATLQVNLHSFVAISP
jgi:YesN/AraC family two-component response regulator